MTVICINDIFSENALYAEPNWGLFRFKNVDNTEVTYEQLTNQYNQYKQI